jgi:hypothetical protein
VDRKLESGSDTAAIRTGVSLPNHETDEEVDRGSASKAQRFLFPGKFSFGQFGRLAIAILAGFAVYPLNNGDIRFDKR